MATIRLVDSAAEERTVNNVVRHEHRVLDAEEKANMKLVKDAGLDFLTILEDLAPSREVSLAKTKIEEAVMWAVRGITK